VETDRHDAPVVVEDLLDAVLVVDVDVHVENPQTLAREMADGDRHVVVDAETEAKFRRW
jgi:hypothetical protein